MLKLWEFLKKRSELQQISFPKTNTAPFTQFCYTPYFLKPSFLEWSINLLSKESPGSQCYILRQILEQKPETTFLAPRFETLQHHYSPTLQGDIESSRFLIFPTPKEIISLNTQLEQIVTAQKELAVNSQNINNNNTRIASISQKIKPLAQKKQKVQKKLEAKLQTAWTEFNQDIQKIFAFFVAKRGDHPQKLQVYCSLPILLNLYDQIQNNRPALTTPQHRLAKVFSYLHQEFPSIQFHSLHTVLPENKPGNSLDTGKSQNLQPLEFLQWGNWKMALLLEQPTRNKKYSSSKFCIYAQDLPLFIDIEIDRFKPPYSIAPKPIFHLPLIQQRKEIFLASDTTEEPPYSQNQQKNQNIGLCLFRSILDSRLSIWHYFSPKTKWKLQGELLLETPLRVRNSSSIKFHTPELQALSLKYDHFPTDYIGVWQQEKFLWKNLQQTAALAVRLTTREQKSFFLLIEREIGQFLSYIKQFEEQENNELPVQIWRKSLHSKSSVQQPLGKDARYFWAELFKNSEEAPFLAVMLWLLWSQLELQVAQKVQRKRPIRRFLQKQQEGFSQLLGELGIERQSYIRPILHYYPSVQSFTALLLLPSILFGKSEIKGAIAWRTFWRNIHKEWPFRIQKVQIYYYWPTWAEKLEQLTTEELPSELLLKNIKSRIYQEYDIFQRVCSLEQQLQKFEQRSQEEALLAKEWLDFQQQSPNVGKLFWKFILRTSRRAMQYKFSKLKHKISVLAQKINTAQSINKEFLHYKRDSLTGWIYQIYRLIPSTFAYLHAQIQTLKQNNRRRLLRFQRLIAKYRQQIAERNNEKIQKRQERAINRIAQKEQQTRERTAAQLQRQQVRQQIATSRKVKRQKQRLQRQEFWQLLWARWHDRWEAWLSPIKKLYENWFNFRRWNHMNVAASVSAGVFALIVVFFVPKEVYSDIFIAAKKTWVHWTSQSTKPVVLNVKQEPLKADETNDKALKPNNESFQDESHQDESDQEVAPINVPKSATAQKETGERQSNTPKSPEEIEISPNTKDESIETTISAKNENLSAPQEPIILTKEPKPTKPNETINQPNKLKPENLKQEIKPTTTRTNQAGSSFKPSQKQTQKDNSTNPETANTEPTDTKLENPTNTDSENSKTNNNESNDVSNSPDAANIEPTDTKLEEPTNTDSENSKTNNNESNDVSNSPDAANIEPIDTKLENPTNTEPENSKTNNNESNDVSNSPDAANIEPTETKPENSTNTEPESTKINNNESNDVSNSPDAANIEPTDTKLENSTNTEPENSKTNNNESNDVSNSPDAANTEPIETKPENPTNTDSENSKTNNNELN